MIQPHGYKIIVGHLPARTVTATANTPAAAAAVVTTTTPAVATAAVSV